jgi:hypothetical protein
MKSSYLSQYIREQIVQFGASGYFPRRFGVSLVIAPRNWARLIRTETTQRAVWRLGGEVRVAGDFSLATHNGGGLFSRIS